MGLLDKLFSFSSEQPPQPNISFGRYTDTYKTRQQYEAWERAGDLFEEERYLESFEAFLDYLKDSKVENVSWQKEKGSITFEIIQGSKKIIGAANLQTIKAESKIALTSGFNIGFLRQLMEENFRMKFSRFAIDDDGDIAIVFNASMLDSAPYKLYLALRELSTKADKLDDLLIEEFDVLEHTHPGLHESLDTHEKEVKYQFIKSFIEEVLNEIQDGTLDANRYPGGVAYLLLNLGYTLDYLTVPQGMLMESLERIHRLYFSQNFQNNLQRNNALVKEFRGLHQQPEAAFLKGMYRVRNTFGITKPVGHDRIVGIIDSELPQMDWYQQNGYDKVALSIPGYIAGYCLFNFAVPKPDYDLFHLFFRILYPDFFEQLGFAPKLYHPKKSRFEQRAISKAIRNIINDNKDQYPEFSVDTDRFDYSSKTNFARSFLLTIRDLELYRVV